MSKDMRESIDARLSVLTVTPEMEMRILEGTKRRKGARVRPSVLAAAACLCLFFILPAFALGIPSFGRLLDRLGSEIGRYLQPIELSDENNDVRMEVIAALSDQESVQAYIAITDLSGEPLAGGIDLYDYKITGLSSYGQDTIVGEDDHSAILQISASGGWNFSGKRVALEIKSILAGRRTFEAFDTGVNLVQITEAKDPVSFNMLCAAGYGGPSSDSSGAVYLILKPDQLNIPLPNVDFAYISNIGLIDGKLHVQVKWPQKAKKTNHVDDHGMLYLKSSAGEIAYPFGIDFGADESGIPQYGNQFSEYIFDVQDLSAYRLFGDAFTTYERYIEGPWKVMFSLKKVMNEKSVSCDINLGAGRITEITLSELGVTINGVGAGFPDLWIAVKLKDGNRVTLDQKMTEIGSGVIRGKYTAQIGELDVGQVDAIMVGGIEVKIP